MLPGKGWPHRSLSAASTGQDCTVTADTEPRQGGHKRRHKGGPLQRRNFDRVSDEDQAYRQTDGQAEKQTGRQVQTTVYSISSKNRAGNYMQTAGGLVSPGAKDPGAEQTGKTGGRLQRQG